MGGSNDAPRLSRKGNRGWLGINDIDASMQARSFAKAMSSKLIGLTDGRPPSTVSENLRPIPRTRRIAFTAALRSRTNER